MSEIDWKQLGVFTSQRALNELLVVYVLAVLAFTVFYFLNKLYFGHFIRIVCGEKSPYFELNEKGRREYWSRNTADLHALLVAPMAYYTCFHTCDDASQNIFSSYECIMKPQRS